MLVFRQPPATSPAPDHAPIPASSPASPYEQALTIMSEALVFGIEPSLDGITQLMQLMGNPQLSYQSIQIAGTNGKSSTARYTAALLHALGKKVGLYTSPELVEPTERIEINGEIITQEDFGKAILTVAAQAQHTNRSLTEFEIVTGAALWYFAEQEVDVAVLEVGLGGRWDATSVVQPTVAAICSIGLDHTAILGDTLEAIAGEKAAIIKAGATVVLGKGVEPVAQVFEQRANELGCELVYAYNPPSQLSYSAVPSYQQANIALAIAAAQFARAKDTASDPTAFLDVVPLHVAQQAINTLQIPGRFETLRLDPLLMIDAAHNPASAQALAAALKAHFAVNGAGKLVLQGNITLLIGILADKDAAAIIDILVPLFADVAVVAPPSPRALQAQDLADMIFARTALKATIYLNVAAALDDLRRQNKPTIATGSIVTAGAVKQYTRP